MAGPHLDEDLGLRPFAPGLDVEGLLDKIKEPRRGLLGLPMQVIELAPILQRLPQLRSASADLIFGKVPVFVSDIGVAPITFQPLASLTEEGVLNGDDYSSISLKNLEVLKEVLHCED